jgi:hypothetical protein
MGVEQRVNRNFEDRKPINPRIHSKENKAIIKALDIYGRVPEQWELLEEIERLNNIIEHIENICKSSIASVDKILLDEKEIKVKDGIVQNRNNYQIVTLIAYKTKSKEILGRIKELKGSDKE